MHRNGAGPVGAAQAALQRQAARQPQGRALYQGRPLYRYRHYTGTDTGTSVIALPGIQCRNSQVHESGAPIRDRTGQRRATKMGPAGRGRRVERARGAGCGGGGAGAGRTLARAVGVHSRAQCRCEACGGVALARRMSMRSALVVSAPGRQGHARVVQHPNLGASFQAARAAAAARRSTSWQA